MSAVDWKDELKTWAWIVAIIAVVVAACILVFG